ncbi:MAG: hypothetical protein NOOUEUKL_001303 [Candidatus Fervidibacter sp.]
MATQEERLRKALSALLMRLPFYGALALRLEHRVLTAAEATAQHIATAATDGRRIFYRAGFLQRLGDEALIFLVAHETLHAALSHPLRGEDKDDARAWNIAADDTVNRLLRPDFRSLPPFAVFVSPQRFGMSESEWERLSTEAKYWLLAKKLPPSETNEATSSGRKEKAAGRSDKGMGQGEKGQGEWEGAGEGTCQLPPAADAPSPEQWRQWLKEAAEFAERVGSYGSVPGWVDEWVMAGEEAKVPWQKVLHQFVQRQVISHWNYPPSRRYQQIALLPRPQRERTGVLGIAIDTSGSISSGQLAQFWREVLAIRQTYPRLTLRLVTCDVEVTSDEVFPPFVALPEARELIGRGGTDFRPAFERFRQPPVPEAVVYLTDGMGEYPTAAPPYPVLWVLSQPLPDWQERLPFGTAVVMEQVQNGG